MEGKLRSNAHIPDFHDAVCDNDLSRAIEQELYLVMYYCPTLLFWSLSRFIFLDRLIKSAPEFRSLWPTGAAIAIRFHVSISAPWAPPLSTASNCISATSNALRSKQGSLIRPETLHQNGITIPPLLLQKSGAGVRVYLPWYIAMTY